jgi:DNA modification methylase
MGKESISKTLKLERKESRSKKLASISLPDIKPQTPIASLSRAYSEASNPKFSIEEVAPLVGMAPAFVARVCGRKNGLSIDDVLLLLDQDAFGETFVPRSKVISYLLREDNCATRPVEMPTNYVLRKARALDLIRSLPSSTLQCVVTSTPYWALRIYKESTAVDWADGSCSPYGHEQTPEEFIRHTIEILYELKRILTDTGSIWWNVMDTFNTRTQIRGNAVEALRAMQGKDKRSWSEHDCRRYSAGHSFLKDGEQCLIPGRIAERASRIGLYIKSVITWAKTGSLPEPQESRVSRNIEYVLHLTKVRSPKFKKQIYRELPPIIGGRNNGAETDKLSDVWILPTSSGRDGHGAQFPLALPGRCIGLSTDPGDLVYDPFVGAGTTGVAALSLGCRFIGSDVSSDYLETAERKLKATHHKPRLL